MVARLWLLIGIGAAALLPAAADAQAPRSMGLLQDALLIGAQAQGAWVGTAEGTAYVLENATDPSAVHYAYAEGAALPERLNLSVRVRIEGAVPSEADLVSGAGLIYAVQPAPLSYFALILSRDGRFRLLQRDADGLHEIDAITVEPFDPDAIHHLRLIEYADGFAAFVDNDAGIDLYTSAVGTGTVGIAAFGTGRFAFQDFKVEEVRGLYVSAIQDGRGNDTQQ